MAFPLYMRGAIYNIVYSVLGTTCWWSRFWFRSLTPPTQDVVWSLLTSDAWDVGLVCVCVCVVVREWIARDEGSTRYTRIPPLCPQKLISGGRAVSTACAKSECNDIWHLRPSSQHSSSVELDSGCSRIVGLWGGILPRLDVGNEGSSRARCSGVLSRERRRFWRETRNRYSLHNFGESEGWAYTPRHYALAVLSPMHKPSFKCSCVWEFQLAVLCATYQFRLCLVTVRAPSCTYNIADSTSHARI